MENIIEKLVKDTIPLISSVDRDEFIMASETAFDCTFDGTSKFYPWKMPTELPKSFKLGLLLEVLVVVNQRYLKILVLKRIQNGYQTNR
jgi:hypothetical protein